MPVPPITRLGRYEIRSLLGAGGMGEVYLAEDTQLHRKVAVKLLPADLSANREGLIRFEREAYATSNLNHPNILTIYEIGEQDGHHFIATEYVEGEPLRKHMRAPMELNEILDVASQVGSALVAAHQAGIVHRDIKPENIMLTRDGLVKVLDFGLAKLTDSQTPVLNRGASTTPMLTEPGAVMGTVSYMSPEQARGVEVDARTDIWSLGVVLYEMVAGRLPFEGATVSDAIGLILNKEPLTLARFAPDVPPELERIVTKALRKKKEERYQGAKDLALDLKTLKRRLEFEAELERSGSPGKISEARRAATITAIHTTSNVEYIVSEVKRHKRGALVIATALVAVIIAVAYFAYSRYLAGSAEVGIRSIAVLPFANTSRDPDTEYLSDGITESLINSLSRLPGVKVIAKSSSFKYKDKEIDPQEVAKALGVQAIVIGRVVQVGDGLQVSAEMVNAQDKTQMWGERYNRKAGDMLGVQSEISREIAENLRLRLSPGEQQRLARRETANPQAYDLLLKGRFYWRKGGTENWKKAVEYYEQAIAVDPNYALAYAELSNDYGSLVVNSILDPKEGTPKAEAALRKALELDETLADAHHALARLRQDAWDWATAEREYKRAIELNPSLAGAHNSYSIYLTFMGRHEQAIAEIKTARELDPLNLSFNANTGWILHFARRDDQAIEVLKRTLELDPKYEAAHVTQGYAYAASGMYAQAIAAYQLGDESSSTQIALGTAYAKAGERDKAQAILKRLQTGKEYVSPGELAILYAALGEREQAFASLEKAYAEHDLQLQYLGVDSEYDSLRSDPRFQQLMRLVGLPL